MNSGTNYKILRVNLTDVLIWTDELDPDLYRLFPGGKGLAAYLLLTELPKGVDPLGPDNLLILANGLLTGAPVSTATRFTAAARSPLTGAYGESEAGGFWGPELKNAGFEAIVISGKSPEPVYLWVNDGAVELKSARRYWGQEPEWVQAELRSELRDNLVRVLQIGLGSENLVRYGAITNELRHFNGRNGIGAVMGSKNLKAIAVRGHSRYNDSIANNRELIVLGKRLVQELKNHPIGSDISVKGTPGITGGMNAGGMLPTRNFREGAFEGIEKIQWDAYEAKLQIGRRSCYACAVRCKREVEVKEGEFAFKSGYGGPEYESVAGFGSNCGVDDLSAIAKANELCNRYTLDAISTSATIAFAMECFEHDLLTLEQTGGIDLRFGNAQAMIQIVEMIARREGLGDLLAEGSQRAAEVIGRGASLFLVTVKSQELSMHDPRGKAGVGLGFAVSENGADHLTSFHDTMLQNPESISFKAAQPLGITSALPARDLSNEKVRTYWIGENWSSFEKVVGLCYFGPVPRSFIQVDEVIKAIELAAGWEVSIEEALRIGERAINLARIFNLREGFSSKEDTLPERLFSPLEAGSLTGVAISREDFKAALTELYRLKGWYPETTAPSFARLKELGIGWTSAWINEV